jgi:hypothetical protein
MTALSQDEALALLGKPPNEVARELANFSETAKILSSNHPRLIDEHPLEWVALYDGRVEVFGKSLSAVMKQLDTKGYPREEVIVRFIDTDEKTLIL